MAKDIDEFIGLVTSEESAAIQAEATRETLARYADENGVIPSSELATAVLNASREEAIALIGAYHHWLHTDESTS